MWRPYMWYSSQYARLIYSIDKFNKIDQLQSSLKRLICQTTFTRIIWKWVMKSKWMIRCWLITVFYYSRWIKAINPKCPYRNLMNYLVVFLLFPSISIMDFILNIFFSSQITCSNTKHYTIITVLVETLVVRDQMQKNFIPCLKVSIYKFSENINRLRSHAKTLCVIFISQHIVVNFSHLVTST